MFQKNMELQLQIEDMSVNGEGIGKADGVAFFVKDAVIGDQVLVKIIKMKKRYGYARLLKILSPSMYRVEPLCKYWRQCGGCQIQALDYMQQLHYKEEKVRNNLRRIGGFSIADTEKKEQGILFHPIKSLFSTAIKLNFQLAWIKMERLSPVFMQPEAIISLLAGTVI